MTHVTAKPYSGPTRVQLPRLGFGGAHLGELYSTLTETQAQETLHAVWDEGVRYFDTAPWYGRGKSEHRMGHFLRQMERDDFLVSTKVGKILRPNAAQDFDPHPWVGGLHFDIEYDYSYDAILRSYEDSLQRLGLTRIDILWVHDLDAVYHHPQTVLERHIEALDSGGGWKALDELRSTGAVSRIGFGLNLPGYVTRFTDLFEPDCFLMAMPYTLLDQAALDEELPLCLERDITVVIGSPYASGILASGPQQQAKYNYENASSEILAKVNAIGEICESHGIPLQAAALQFPLRHPSVASVIPGAVSPQQVRQNSEFMQWGIPTSLWDELKTAGLLRRDAPTER